MFILFENFGVLRQVSRFVRQETGIREMEFYKRMLRDVRASPDRWPTLDFMLGTMTEYMVPPGSWQFFIDEIARYLVTELGIADDSALRTVLAVQHALLPARDRQYPVTLELEHDVAAWHDAMMAAKHSGSRQTWETEVPPLRSFGPTTFEVDDPQSISTLGLGMSVTYDPDSDWELASPVARTMRFRHTVHA
jgi:hypothetical protein